MLTYIFAFFTVVAFSRSSPRGYGPSSANASLSTFIFAFLLLFIGLRDNVGGDWGSYLRYLERSSTYSFADLFLVEEPGYQFLNYLSSLLGGGIWLVNLLCALFFLFGLFAFCKRVADPQLALIVAFPYLIVVVAMGYSRQSVALGFFLYALPYLFEKQVIKFSIFILFGALFHKSAIIFLPLALIFSGRRRILTIPVTLILFYIGFQALLAESVDRLISTYIGSYISSSGAMVRVLMCLIPATIFLGCKKRFMLNSIEMRFWTLISFSTYICFLLLLSGGASTAVDRLALYLIPIQLFVFGNARVLVGYELNQNVLTIIISFYALIILIGWIQLGDHSHYWLPYRNFILN